MHTEKRNETERSAITGMKWWCNDDDAASFKVYLHFPQVQVIVSLLCLSIFLPFFLVYFEPA
jgi:hypothetical protein